MSNERLEELKGVLESWGAWSDWNESQRKVLKDLACLLERVQELEKLCKQLIGEEWMNDEGLYDSEMMKLEKENQRYKQAVDGLEERNSFLERAHRTNINIAEHALEERDRYKQALEESDYELNRLYSHVERVGADKETVLNALEYVGLTVIKQALAGDTNDDESKA